MKLQSKLLLTLVSLFAPAKMLLLSVGILILVDLITGIWAALKRGERIKSAALRRTVSKMFIYQLAVISGFLVEHYMLDGFLPVSKIVASVIGMVELASVLENANTILGQNLFGALIKKLGSDNDLKEMVEKQIDAAKDKSK